jgi:hypothetical protein
MNRMASRRTHRILHCQGTLRPLEDIHRQEVAYRRQSLPDRKASRQGASGEEGL